MKHHQTSLIYVVISKLLLFWMPNLEQIIYSCILYIYIYIHEVFDEGTTLWSGWGRMPRSCCQMSCIQGPLRFGVSVTDNLTLCVNNLRHKRTIKIKFIQHDIQKWYNIIQIHKVGRKQLGCIGVHWKTQWFHKIYGIPWHFFHLTPRWVSKVHGQWRSGRWAMDGRRCLPI